MANCETKVCEQCKITFVRASHYNTARWTKMRFCSSHCFGLSKRKAPRQRLLDNHTINPNGCWEWSKSINKHGYGILGGRGIKTTTAHRLSYKIFIGNIPDELHVCHRCDNRRCINPEHLFLGTPLDNMLDKIAKGRANPPRGEQHRSSKLTKEQVLKIRDDCRMQKHIAAEYGIAPATVSQIKGRQRWAHI